MLIAEIRFCTGEDVARVVEVDKTSPYPWPEQIIAKDLLSEEAGLSYVGAFATGDSGRLLGYAVLGSEKGGGLLMNLVVLPHYRRQGIGIQLLVAVAECAAEMGFSSLALRVRESNYAALALYRSLGFKGDATRGGFYSNGDAAQYMSLKLPLVVD